MPLAKKVWVAVSVVVLLCSVGMAAYPLVSNALADRATAQVVTAAVKETEASPPDDLAAERAAAVAYNRELATGVVEGDRSYDGLLDLSGSGMMGILEISRISVTLPIYHGTSGEVLGKGAGHLYGTSLPVGGESTHAVLTGHTGMAGRRMFTDLDQLALGDTFCLRVLGETLTYEVDQIKVVLPSEVEDLQIIPGEDHVTLVTCTPYGVNSHRLLVRGARVMPPETADEAAEETPSAAPSTWRRQYLLSFLPGLAIAAVIVTAALTARKMHSRRKGKTRTGG